MYISKNISGELDKVAWKFLSGNLVWNSLGNLTYVLLSAKEMEQLWSALRDDIRDTEE